MSRHGLTWIISLWMIELTGETSTAMLTAPLHGTERKATADFIKQRPTTLTLTHNPGSPKGHPPVCPRRAGDSAFRVQHYTSRSHRPESSAMCCTNCALVTVAQGSSLLLSQSYYFLYDSRNSTGCSTECSDCQQQQNTVH